jgi:hypothetical protein
MIIHDCWGLLGSVLLLTAACSAPFRGQLLGGKRWLAMGVFATIMLLPFWHGLSAAAVVRGHIGDLSVTTVLLLLLASLSGTAAIDRRSRRFVLAAALCGGLALYPLSLGQFPYDPYVWGYSPQWMLLAIGVIIATIARRYPVASCMLALPLLGYGLNLEESPNLWDYLLDPLLVLYSIWVLLLKPLITSFHNVRS